MKTARSGIVASFWKLITQASFSSRRPPPQSFITWWMTRPAAAAQAGGLAWLGAEGSVIGRFDSIRPVIPSALINDALFLGLGSIGLVGGRLLPGGPGVGTEDGVSGDLQFRSTGAVHQRGFHAAAGGAWDHHQHGWARTGDGQYFCGAAVAKREVRRGLSEGLRANVRGRDESSKLLSVLQFTSGVIRPWAIRRRRRST